MRKDGENRFVVFYCSAVHTVCDVKKVKIVCLKTCPDYNWYPFNGKAHMTCHLERVLIYNFV